jgi:hypothetical protein
MDLWTSAHYYPVHKAVYKQTARTQNLTAVNSRSWNPGGCSDDKPAGGSTYSWILKRCRVRMSNVAVYRRERILKTLIQWRNLMVTGRPSINDTGDRKPK